MTRTATTVLRILSGILLLFGSAAFAWGAFCFLGGPDGQPWERVPLIAGALSWVAAALCGGIYLLLNRGAERARLVLLLVWAGMLGAICVPALIAAVVQGVWKAASAPAVLLIFGGVAATMLLRRKRK